MPTPAQGQPPQDTPVALPSGELLPRPCRYPWSTYPEVTLSNRALGHVHPALLRFQLLIEGLVQSEAVDQVAAHIQAEGLACHLHGDILPLGVSQTHVLQGDDVLGAIDPVGEVQRVGRTVGHNLELPVGGPGAVQGQQRAPGLAVLLEAGRAF